MTGCQQFVQENIYCFLEDLICAILIQCGVVQLGKSWLPRLSRKGNFSPLRQSLFMCSSLPLNTEEKRVLKLGYWALQGVKCSENGLQYSFSFLENNSRHQGGILYNLVMKNISSLALRAQGILHYWSWNMTCTTRMYETFKFFSFWYLDSCWTYFLLKKKWL